MRFGIGKVAALPTSATLRCRARFRIVLESMMKSTLYRDVKRACLFSSALAFLGLGSLMHAAHAQDDYPNRAVRIVVPFSPGGGGDAVVRYMSDKLAERLKQQIIVENKPGASGFIGAQIVATAAPDGYTLLMGFDGGIVVAPNMLNAPFNPLLDFAPVTKLNDATIILVANPSVPVKNISDIVALAKSKPDGLQFSSSGPGTTPHLAGELLALRTGMKLSHIPYKGGGQAVTDAVAGHFPIFFTVVPTVASYIKQGRLTAIAVAGDKRSPALPNVPTIAELGVPDFNVSSWYGILAPAKTPKAIIDRLQKDIAAVLAIPEVRERYVNNAFDPVGSTPEAFAAQIKADYERWGLVVKEANLKQ